MMLLSVNWTIRERRVRVHSEQSRERETPDGAGHSKISIYTLKEKS